PGRTRVQLPPVPCRSVKMQIGGSRWEIRLDDYVSSLDVDPNGELVAVGSLAGDVCVIDIESGTIVARLNDHPLGALAIAWSHDGDRVAVGGQDAIVRIYDRSGTELSAVSGEGWAHRLAWSPTDELLAIGAGRQLVLTDRDGAVVRRHDDVASPITEVVWSADGRRVGAAAYGGVAWFDPADDATAPRRIHTRQGSILALALSPDGKWACGGAQDASIQIWKLWSGDELAMSGYDAKVERMAFSDDGQWLACACLGEMSWWDFSGKGPRRRAPATGDAHTKHVESIAWRLGGDVLVTGGADGRLALWRAPSRPGQTLRPDHTDDGPGGVSQVAWHPDGASVLAGRDDGTVERRAIAGEH
ncbi:MAG: hypothetical protein AAGG08_17870, partial [Actinomycetota bacterium]